MTAEIAVVNKGAVALAADSAGTIGTGAATKIYNTVVKIFELSSHEPVGVMLYGALEFMGLPLETIIKEFRRELGQNSFTHVDGYASAFCDYLSNLPYGPRQQHDNTIRLLRNSLEGVVQRIQADFLNAIGENNGFKLSKYNGVAEKQINLSITELQQRSYPSNFFTRIPSAFMINNLTAIDEAIDIYVNGFRPLTSANRNKLRKYASLCLLRLPMSAARTGLVFAGFGTAEICPTIIAVEVDGMVSGKLKRHELNRIDIGRDTISAEILGFAQNDMVERFVNGVDPTYDSQVFEAFNGIMSGVLETIRSDMAKSGKKSSSVEALSSLFTNMLDSAREELAKYRQENFRQPTIDLVRFMPKQELARLAESMIELTSLKRRVSWDQETVGGDVDVAVISKSEGFVWIKRKHYFPADINPRYFHRLATAKEEAK